MAIWNDVPSEHERRIFGLSRFSRRVGFGKKPALLVIDVTYAFVGDRPEPISESIKRFPLSCGEAGWKPIEQIALLLPLARRKKVPLFYVDRSYEIKKPSPAHSRLIRKWDHLNFRSNEVGQIGQGHRIYAKLHLRAAM